MNEKRRFIIDNNEIIDEFIGDVMSSVNKLIRNVPSNEWFSYDRQIALIGKFAYLLLSEFEDSKRRSNFTKLIFALNKVIIEMQPYWIDMISNIQETIILNSLGVGKNVEEEE